MRPRRAAPRRRPGARAHGPLALLFAGLLGACAGAGAPARPGTPAPRADAQVGELPEYALPQAQVMDESEYAATDLIPYRRLTREDFRGTAPPAQVAAHADAAGAFTCGSIASVGTANARFDPTAKPGIYVARFTGAAFASRMDRGCSWWNPTRKDIPAAYVLEHEQIHFALTELAARHLTAKLRAVSLETTPEEGPALLQRHFDALLDEAREELLRVNTDFDRDTSGRYAPDVQRGWLERVERELAD